MILTLRWTVVMILLWGIPAWGNSNFPNEPSGYGVLLNDPMNCPGLPTTPCPGWTIGQAPNFYNYSSSTTDATTTAAGTASPTTVVQVTYPVGFPQGYEPVTSSFYLPNNRNDLFYGYWLKMSSPWQEEAAGVDKQFFLWQQPNPTYGNSNLIIERYFGSLIFAMETMNPNVCNLGKCGGIKFFPANTGDASFSLGSWHKVEALVHLSTTVSSGDGRLDMWLDGVHTHHYTSVNFDTGAWQKLSLAPTWGGCCGQTKTEQDYYWLDHTYVSTSGLSLTSAPPAPTGLTVR